MKDANSALQAAVTKTADFASSGLDLKSGTPLRGLTAVVTVTALTDITGVVFKIQESDDNNTFNDLVTFDTVTAVGEYTEKFTTSKRYVKLDMNLTGGGSASITYSGYVTL